MLDKETKNKIDTARDILVGRVPDPKSQVEQITIALIYKFMDDMDKEVEELGGKPSFFKGEFAKYSWSKIFDPRISGHELVTLYGEAIDKMNINPNIPQLFRDIFKNAYLPYRDPETLKGFLKIINEFQYSHSEKLGDAYEYLLSVLGSQGDAGQFRTPRHIIDFIVEVVAPKKTEKILDPACGTAGFLISSYKQILKDNTKKNMGDRISPEERKVLINNFTGYDISPDMIRLSLVNLYLHGFTNPKIHEYDTLTSEERWNEYYDVILANPPFMSPTGGIRPHKKFSIKANRSEVLFVDYICEHLTPNGRAGIIVPNGIVSTSHTAYIALRKTLVEKYLWAVLALPAGVFNPYSGINTYVLLIDKQLCRKSDKIVFIKIENDGYDLGAQRREIDKNDLPNVIKLISDIKLNILNNKEYKENSNSVTIISKNEILCNKDILLTADRYLKAKDFVTEFEKVRLGEVLDYEQPTNYIVKSVEYNDNFRTPVLTAGKSFILGYTNEKDGIYDKELPVIIFDDFTTATKFVDFPFKVKSSAMKILKAKKKIADLKYLYYIIQEIEFNSEMHKRYWISQYSQIEVPLPPLTIQEEIVQRIERYEKIIDGAKQVVENYITQIDIEPEWEMVELGKICDIKSGGTPKTEKKEYWENGTIPWLGSSVCKDEYVIEPTKYITQKGLENSSAKILRPGTTLIALVGATIGKTGFLTFEATTNQNISGLYPINELKLNTKYLYNISQTLYQEFMKLGSGKFRMANLSFIKSLKIPLPTIEEQEEIVNRIEQEQRLVDANKELIKIYEQRIKDEINKVWEK